MGNVFPGRLIGERTGPTIYCITVPCMRALDDLAQSWQPYEVHLLVAIVAICVAMLAARAALVNPSAYWRALLATATVALVLTLVISVPENVDTRRVAHHVAPHLHLHSCWDDLRCDANNFSVYLTCQPEVEGSQGCLKSLDHALTLKPEEVPPIYIPPAEIPIARTANEACVVVHITPANSAAENVAPRLAPPCAWREQLRSCRTPAGGRNHVILARGDGGIEWSTRLAKLGCAMLVQTHAELSNYVPGFDISIPLGLVPGRGGAPSQKQLESLARFPRAPNQPALRRWWLTFRGSIDYGMREHRAWLLPLASHSTLARPIVIAAKCARKKEGTYNARDVNKSVCRELDRTFNLQPSYLDLLNSTFALLPGGLQPASFRMDEVMAAGSIPVFITGDVDTSSPYVRPFEPTIDWARCSLSFPWERAHRIPHVLGQLSDVQIAKMQRAVQHAWHTYLRPPLAHRRTLYEMLKQRATAPYQRR